jgi:hypothetical protein
LTSSCATPRRPRAERAFVIDAQPAAAAPRANAPAMNRARIRTRPSASACSPRARRR